MRRGHFLEHDHAGSRIEPSHFIAGLHREPQRTFLVEHRSVRVVHTLVRKWVFGDLARSRIELSDVAFGICGEPDVACVISHQAMRAGVGRLLAHWPEGVIAESFANQRPFREHPQAIPAAKTKPQ